MGNYNKEVHILVRADANTSGLGRAEKDLNNLGNAIREVNGAASGLKGKRTFADAFGFSKIINEALVKTSNIKDEVKKGLAEAQRTLAEIPIENVTAAYAAVKNKWEQLQKVKDSILKNREKLDRLSEKKAAKGTLGTTDQRAYNTAARMVEKNTGIYEKRIDELKNLIPKYEGLREKYARAENAVRVLDNGNLLPEISDKIFADMRQQVNRRNEIARRFFSENVNPYLAQWGHATDFKGQQEMLSNAHSAMLTLANDLRTNNPVGFPDKTVQERLNSNIASALKLSNAAKYFDSFMGDYGKYSSELEELKKNVGSVLGSAPGSLGDAMKMQEQMGGLAEKAGLLGGKFNASLDTLTGKLGDLGHIPGAAGGYLKDAYTDILSHASTLANEIEDIGRLQENIKNKHSAGPAIRSAIEESRAFVSGWNETLKRTGGKPGEERAWVDESKVIEEVIASVSPKTAVSQWGQAAEAIINSKGWNEAIINPKEWIPPTTPPTAPPTTPPTGPQATATNNRLIVPPEFGGGTGGNRPKSGLAQTLWGGEPVNLRQIIHGIKNPTDENGEAIKNIENSTFWYAMSDATRQIGHVAWRNTLHSAQVSMDEYLKFEGAMTDILKHFAGLRNETTNLPNEKYFAMREKIIAMSKDLPLSQTDIALAAGRAARMGIDEPDLLRNVELATKLGVGFNMSPDAVMESIAKIAASSGISPSDNKALLKIGDAINYLDDHTNATGEDIFEFLKDSTAGGKTIGLSVGETAAIGTALMSLGTNPSVAKTAFKNLMLIATSGPRNQKKGERYLSYAGIENEEMMKRMRANPRQGLLWILKKLAGAKNNEVGKDTASIIRFVTGQQSALPTMKLTSKEGIATLERLFNMLDNAAGGWTEKEYETKMKADPNREMALLENALKELRIEFGKNLFPAVKEFAPVIKDVMRGVGGFMANNPKLVQGMVGGGLAIGASANAMATISDAMIIFDAIRRAGGFKNLKSLGGMFTALSPLLAIQTNQVLPTIGAELTNLWGALKGGGKGLWGVLGGAWKTMTTVPLGNVSAVGTAAGVGGAAVLGTMIGSQIWKYIDENYIIPKQQAEAKAEAESGAARKGRVNNIALERAHKSRLETERYLLEERLESYQRAEEKRQLTTLPGDYDYPRFSPGREMAEGVRERLDKVNQEIKFSEWRIEGARARAQVLPSKDAPEGTSFGTRDRWGTLNRAGADWMEQRQYWEGKKSFYDAKLAENPSLRNNEATMGNYGDIQNKLREIKAFQQEIQNQADALVVKAMEEQKKYFADYRVMNEALAKIDRDRWDNITTLALPSLRNLVTHSEDAGGKMKNSFDPVLDSFNAKLGIAQDSLKNLKNLAESMKALDINININGQTPARKGGTAIPIGGGKGGGKGVGSFPMSLPGSMGMSFLLDSPTANNQTYNSTANITINNNSPSSQIAVNQWARQLGGILGGANREAAVYA